VEWLFGKPVELGPGSARGVGILLVVEVTRGSVTAWPSGGYPGGVLVRLGAGVWCS
jgi:hypothetical protein